MRQPCIPNQGTSLAPQRLAEPKFGGEIMAIGKMVDLCLLGQLAKSIMLEAIDPL